MTTNRSYSNDYEKIIKFLEEAHKENNNQDFDISEDKDRGTYQNYQYINSKTFDPVLPDGFEFACHYDVKDDYVRQYAVHKGFHPNDEFPAPEAYVIPFLNTEKAPMFDGNLEIMLKDKLRNKYIGMGIFWHNRATNTALLEPMSIHPEYQCKNLGYNLVQEGLRKLKDMGAEKVYVEAFNSKRRNFYNKCGFITYDCVWNWTKNI
ncbi:MAG: GNAT family N-acetyltransferase [Oscillospiraceae bacterium]|nr:GNAT family N-acetyltransferase [Oscillospiraceae bacterium]